MRPALARIRVRPLTLGLSIFLLFPAASLGQEQRKDNGAALDGTVVDPAARAVKSAAVVVKNESSVVVGKTVTDDLGKFSVSNLPDGTYTVEVSARGFAPAAREGVHVVGGRTPELSIPLSLGTVSEAITVEANTSDSIAAQAAPMDGMFRAG